VGVAAGTAFNTEVTEGTEKSRDEAGKTILRSLRDRTPYLKFEIGYWRRFGSCGQAERYSTQRGGGATKLNFSG
jgi:hypothetical protein